jgi:hypothetical protein
MKIAAKVMRICQAPGLDPNYYFLTNDSLVKSLSSKMTTESMINNFIYLDSAGPAGLDPQHFILEPFKMILLNWFPVLMGKLRGFWPNAQCWCHADFLRGKPP